MKKTKNENYTTPLPDDGLGEVVYIIEEYQDEEPGEGGETVSEPSEEPSVPTKDKKATHNKKKKRKKKHRLRKFLLALALLLLLLYGVLVLYFLPMNSVDLEKKPVQAALTDRMSVSNILVIGTDTRDPQAEAGRSDAILLFSVNRWSRTVTLTSFLRDSYVTIPGHGENRINAAFQYGGAPLLIQTIEENFHLAIDAYAVVDFYSFMQVIDAVGGVEIDVDEGEANYVNMYLCEINQLLGVEQGNGNLTSAGRQVLNGKQALAYSRIRYIGTDFARTDRQREVFEAMLSAAKAHPIITLANVREIFPSVETSLSPARLGGYALEAPVWALYTVQQQRIPADHTWKDYVAGPGMEVLQMDFEANREILRKMIYNIE